MNNMNNTARQYDESQRIGWFPGIVIALLLLSLGFELIAHQVFGPTSMATLVLTMYLGVWFAALGIAGFLVLSVRWVVEALQLKRRGGAFDPHVVEEPGSPDLAGQDSNVHVIQLEREDHHPTTRNRVA